MIIELDEWEDWRISGERNDWQIQTTHKKGKSAGEWYGTNFFSSLEWAIAAAFERTLRESPATARTFEDAQKEFKRVKDELMRAVRKAVKP